MGFVACDVGVMDEGFRDRIESLEQSMAMGFGNLEMEGLVGGRWVSRSAAGEAGWSGCEGRW